MTNRKISLQCERLDLQKVAIDWATAGRAAGIQAKRVGLRATNTAKNVAQGVMNLPGGIARAPGTLGDIALDGLARGGNVIGNAAKKMGVPGATNTLGKNTVQAARNAANKVVGMGTKTTSPFNPINVATGAGIIGAGAYGASRMAGGAQAQQPQAPAAPTQPQAPQGQPGMPLSQRGREMWNNLPVEARYAIGAGIPAALIGGYMGGTGGKMLAGLGLGAAGLGAAGGGMFGEGAQRFIGKQMYNMGTFFGGNSGDYGSQIGMLSRLSPQLGATVLMGRDPNLSRDEAMQQYMFLTKNKDMIQRMLPNLTRKTAGDLAWLAHSGWAQKASKSRLFHHAPKQLEPVVNDTKPTSRGDHINIVHHELEDGVTMKPEEAEMHPDMKAVPD